MRPNKNASPPWKQPRDYYLTLWMITVRELEIGDFPSSENLILALRSEEEVPQIVREWVARLVEGNLIKRPRGAPKSGDWYETETFGNWVRAVHEDYLERIKNDIAAEKQYAKSRGKKYAPVRGARAPFELALLQTQKAVKDDGYGKMSLAKLSDIVKGLGKWRKEFR